MKIGSHVSNSGDEMLVLSVKEALSFKENSFMIYLGPPQNTMRKDYDRLNAYKFREILNENNISLEDVIVHAPYIVNFAQINDEKRKFAIDFMTREMKTMARVGCKYIVAHPGSHMNAGIEKGIELISDSFKRILENTKDDDTCILIETMAGKGSECCFDFSHIAKIIENVNSDRLKVCFDTCHVHDAGYDIINDYQGVISEFDRLIGIDKIAVFHINDSLNVKGARKDRHANFGFGQIGFDALMQFINDDRFKDIPKILETPYVKTENGDFPPYKYEIEMIKSGKFDKGLLEKIVRGE